MASTPPPQIKCEAFGAIQEDLGQDNMKIGKSETKVGLSHGSTDMIQMWSVTFSIIGRITQHITMFVNKSVFLITRGF